jgi:cell pole-organizing protein PopZ
MSEENQEEPSIEEILASIRQIISDDEDETVEENNDIEVESEPEPEPVVEAKPAAAAEKPEAPKPEPEIVEEDEILELTEKVDEDDALDDDILPEVDEAPMGDFNIDFDGDDDDLDADEIEEVAIIEEIEEVMDDSLAEIENIIEGEAAQATLGAFERLAQSIPVARTGSESNTLEDIVRDMLRPMLRQWVDANMPAIAERLVKKELERLVDKALD